MQRIGHVVVERRGEAGTEILEEQIGPDHPQPAGAERGEQAAKGVFELGEIDARPFLLDEIDGAEADNEAAPAISAAPWRADVGGSRSINSPPTREAHIAATLNHSHC